MGGRVFENLIREHLLDLKEDGSFRLDMSYFNYCQGLTMTSPEFHKLFGGRPRQAGVALSRSATWIWPRRSRSLPKISCCAGPARSRSRQVQKTCAGRRRGAELRGQRPHSARGTFQERLDSAGRGRCRRRLGAALFIWYQLLDKPRHPQKYDQQKGSFLGPSYSDDQIAEFLDRVGAVYTTCGSDDELCDEVSSIVAEEKVVGWFQGRMEFGPRALGHGASSATRAARRCSRS